MDIKEGPDGQVDWKEVCNVRKNKDPKLWMIPSLPVPEWDELVKKLITKKDGSFLMENTIKEDIVKYHTIDLMDGTGDYSNLPEKKRHALAAELYSVAVYFSFKGFKTSTSKSKQLSMWQALKENGYIKMQGMLYPNYAFFQAMVAEVTRLSSEMETNPNQVVDTKPLFNDKVDILLKDGIELPMNWRMRRYWHAREHKECA